MIIQLFDVNQRIKCIDQYDIFIKCNHSYELIEFTEVALILKNLSTSL